MRAFIVLLASMVLLEPVLAAGVNFHEAFVGMPLELDAKIETPAVNSKIQALTPKNIGEIVEFQLFVPAAAGKSSVGFNIEFELVGKTFLNNFSQLTGTAHDGTTLLSISGKPVVSALMLSKPAFPSTGYLGTVRMTVTGPITEGNVLRIKAATIGDVNADGDVLTVSNALITFSNNTPPIPGDIDLDGDVDFFDFLTFTKNYGRTGPKPSTQEKTIIVSVRDTVQIVKHDTLYITRRDTVRLTVRDTVYLSGTAPPTQPTVPTKGSNANAISSLDLVGIGVGVVGNGTDDKIVQGTISGSRTRVVVEVFAAGLSKGLTGAHVKFDIDTRILRVVSVTAPSTFPLVLPRTDTTATVGAFAPGFPPNGLLMTVTFETGPDVTGVKFSIGLKSLEIAVSPTDTDILTAGRITFNTASSIPGTPKK